MTSKKAAEEYSAQSLTVLEGLDAVRKRPGMYIGSTDSRGLTHCAFEIIDNSVDEALAGYCTHINVTLHSDGSIEVKDNGRGIPVDIEPKTGMTGVELVFTKLHAGGKFGGGSYAVSGGLHGVGASVVNALSRRVDVEVHRDGKVHALSFSHGVAGAFATNGNFKPAASGKALRVTGKTTERGTIVRYWPDPDIFIPGATVDIPAIHDRLRQTAFLVPGVVITLTDQTGEQEATEEFSFAGGVKDYCDYRAQGTAIADTILLQGEGTFTEKVPVLTDHGTQLEDVERTVWVSAALRWDSNYETDISSYVNIVATPKGGTHLAGFDKALVKAFNEQMRTVRVLKTSDEGATRDDICEGLTAIIAVKLAEPQFEGQTKEVLGTKDVTGIVQDIIVKGLTDWFEGRKTKAQAKTVMDKAGTAMRNRVAAREVRETRRRKSSLDNAMMPAKLVDCRTHDLESSELFIVEGDSALGTFKMARDSEFQAALPIRGKILNTLKASEKQMLSNAECSAIIQVIGGGSGKHFNLDDIRYGKLIFMADADVDGAHIRCLLLTLVYRYMRPLLEAGRVYSAVPPLHRIKIRGGKNPEYLFTYTDEEMQREVARLRKKGMNLDDTAIARFKGLGEMGPRELRDSATSPATRTLRRINISDAALAEEIFQLTMGENVANRRELIVSGSSDVDATRIDF